LGTKQLSLFACPV